MPLNPSQYPLQLVKIKPFLSIKILQEAIMFYRPSFPLLYESRIHNSSFCHLTEITTSVFPHIRLLYRTCHPKVAIKLLSAFSRSSQTPQGVLGPCTWVRPLTTERS